MAAPAEITIEPVARALTTPLVAPSGPLSVPKIKLVSVVVPVIVVLEAFIYKVLLESVVVPVEKIFVVVAIRLLTFAVKVVVPLEVMFVVVANKLVMSEIKFVVDAIIESS